MTQFQISKPSFSLAVLLSAALLGVGLSASPASADGFFVRNGAAATDNGRAAWSRSGVTNGQDAGALRRGAWAVDSNGNASNRFARCGTSPSASVCQGRTATLGTDGSWTRQSGTEPANSTSSSSSRKSLAWDPQTAWSGARTTDASGRNGSYSGAATVDQGSYDREGTYTGNEGQNATVNSAYTRSTGGSRTVTCIDASGATVTCP